MSASEALMAARNAGVDLHLDGDGLLLEASAPPSIALVDQLSRNKLDIIALLKRGSDGWSSEDWQAFYDERAGIAEFDGGLSRIEAESLAFACCVEELLERISVGSLDVVQRAEAIVVLAAMGIEERNS